MTFSFLSIVKSILKQLLHRNYLGLNSRLFFEIWLTFVLDRGLTSMRSLFYRLNHPGIPVDISTFSKACKTRQDHYLGRIYNDLKHKSKRKNASKAQMLFPIDSIVVTLTSKLF